MTGGQAPTARWARRLTEAMMIAQDDAWQLQRPTEAIAFSLAVGDLLPDRGFQAVPDDTWDATVRVVANDEVTFDPRPHGDDHVFEDALADLIP